MKFWFAFPFAMLLFSHMWLDRFDPVDVDRASAGVTRDEVVVGAPPDFRTSEGGIGVPPQ